MRRQRLVRQRLGHEGADTGPGCDEASVLELAVGLEHGVGVDREPRHHVFDRGELITFGEQAEPERLPHLLDQLQVWRDARAPVQVKLDQRSSLHLTRYLAL